jgi:hypothetical protein
MINVAQITSQLAKMPDQALQQYAAMHKNDPYTVALALAESNRRKEIRGASQGMGAMPQPKVVDQDIAGMAQPMPEDVGIGQLPAPNMQGMAEGGIVAFEGGGEVPGYAGGTLTQLKRKYKELKGYEFEGGPEMFDKALDAEGIKDPKQRAFLKSIHAQESDQALNAPTRDKSGAMGPMQVTKGAWSDVSAKGDALKNRADPFDNMRAGIRYASAGWDKSGGDPVLAGAYYYGGPGGLSKAQKGEAVASSEDKGQTTLQYGKQVAARMPTMLPGISTAQAAPVAPAPTEDMSYWDKNKKAIVDAGTKGIGALGGAAAGAYEALTPSFAPSTTLKQAALRTANTAGPLATLGLTGGTLAAGATNALSNATPEQLDQLSGDVGSDTGLAAAIMNAPNRPPETPAMPYGQQMGNVAGQLGQAVKTVLGHPDTRSPSAPAPVVEEPKGGMSDLNQAFRQFELAQQNKAEETPVAQAAPAPEGIEAIAPEEKKGGMDWNDFMIKMGLSMMAGKSPHALTNVGEAGLSALSLQQAEAKAKAEEEYRKAMGLEATSKAKQAEAMTAAIERGAKEKNIQLEAEKLVQQHMDKWGSGIGKFATLSDKSAPLAEEARAREMIYRQLGITPTMAAGTSGAPGGQKLVYNPETGKIG